MGDYLIDLTLSFFFFYIWADKNYIMKKMNVVILELLEVLVNLFFQLLIKIRNILILKAPPAIQI